MNAPTYRPVATPQPGDWADSKTGLLDPRRVAWVSPDGSIIKLDILGLMTGPLPARAYTFTREES